MYVQKCSWLISIHCLPAFFIYAIDIFQKLSNSSCYGDRLVCEDVHVTLVQLLSSRELVSLQCALCALINICKRWGGGEWGERVR